MQVLQCVNDPESGPCVKVKSCMAQRRKIDQQHTTMRFLKGNGRIDRNRGCTRSALSVGDSEYPRPTGRSTRLASRRREARESLDQSFGTGMQFKIFTSPRTHGGDNRRRVIHGADRENRDVAGSRMDQLDSADRTLHVVGINIDQHDFGSDILDLAHHRIDGAGGKADMGENVSPHVGRLQTMLEHRNSLFVLG